jgi:hypothetical protein
MPEATVEIVSPEMSTVGRIALRPGQLKTIDVPSESSFVRVHLASGEIINLYDPGNLKREISRSTIEQHLRRGRVRSPSRPRNVADLQLGDHGLFNEAVTLPLVSTRLILLEGDVKVQLLDSANQPQPGESREGGAGGIFKPSYQMTPYDLTIETGGVRASTRLPGMLREVVIRSDEVAQGQRVISVRVQTLSEMADVIGAYVNRGDVHSAAAMTDWIKEAEELLFGKMDNPFAAAVGAYLLLRIRHFDLLRNWAKNLADRFPQMSDGSVIWSWQQVYQRGEEAEIRRYLKRALDGPLPICTEGLQLLSDGARLLSDEMPDAARTLDKRCGTVLWNSPFTTTCFGDRIEHAPGVQFDIDFARAI